MSTMIFRLRARLFDMIDVIAAKYPGIENILMT